MKTEQQIDAEYQLIRPAFVARLNEKGYMPKEIRIPHPPGVKIGGDGFIAPSVWPDFKNYIERMSD